MTDTNSSAWDVARVIYDGCSTGPVCPQVFQLANGWARIRGYVPSDPGGEEIELILPPEVLQAIKEDRSAG